MSNFEKLQGRLAAGETILMDGGMGLGVREAGAGKPHHVVGRSDAHPSRVGEGYSSGIHRSGRRDHHHKHLWHAVFPNASEEVSLR